MTTNSVQEEQPMIMSTCPVTSGNENDSQVVPVENHSQVLDIDVTPTPQPPVDHYLELEGDDGIRATLVCKSRPGAECRMVHDCACEEYCACEPPSRMVDIGECNHANWINADVYATDQGKAGTRIAWSITSISSLGSNPIPAVGHQGFWNWEMPEGLNEKLRYPIREAS